MWIETYSVDNDFSHGATNLTDDFQVKALAVEILAEQGNLSFN
jgi:hypothetical protein